MNKVFADLIYKKALFSLILIVMKDENDSLSRRDFLRGGGAVGTAALLGVDTEYEIERSKELSELGEYVEEHVGFVYDTVIPEDLFEENRDEIYETDTTIVTDYWPEATVYRDKNKYFSVQVSDYRGVEREGLEDDVLVGHLEFFNPDFAPVRHALTDYPLWKYKNRIIEDREL